MAGHQKQVARVLSLILLPRLLQAATKRFSMPRRRTGARRRKGRSVPPSTWRRAEAAARGFGPRVLRSFATEAARAFLLPIHDAGFWACATLFLARRGRTGRAESGCRRALDAHDPRRRHRRRAGCGTGVLSFRPRRGRWRRCRRSLPVPRRADAGHDVPLFALHDEGSAGQDG